MNLEEFRASLSDKDLIGIDSEFTYSTRKLIEAFGACAAHLNKWWVMTSVDWSCPACSRKKSEIVRLNKYNFLICHLHEHHDHMKEVVKSLFEKFSTSRDRVVANELSERFAIKTAFSLSAYDNTVICFDCNKADADAKKLIGAHKYFSFSPDEIKAFIKTTPNREHQIDEVTAVDVWRRVEPTFRTRMEMAERFARIAAEKMDWYQPSTRTARDTARIAKHFFELNGLLDIDQHEPERLLYNTTPFKGENKSWRTTDSLLIRKIPSDNEISHLAATRGNYWRKYDSNWSCPCCDRSKIHCVRPSKKNPWVLEIKTVPLFIERDSSVDYRPDPMCADCIDTAINLGREVQNEGGSVLKFASSVITLQELSSIVIARPHSRHLFKNSLIDQLMPVFLARADQIEILETN